MISEECYKNLLKFRIRTFADTVRSMGTDSAFDDLDVGEIIEMAVDAEVCARHDRRVEKNNKAARFKDGTACPEDIVYMPQRILSKDSVARLTTCDFVRENHNLIVISQTGCGKSYLSQAIGNAACRKEMTVRYVRHADMCKELNIARRNGDR